MTDIVETAATITTLLSPYTPYLKDAAKVAGTKLIEVVAQKGGEAGWNKAQEIWQKITGKVGEAPDLQNAAGLVASKPDDATYQTVLAKVLATYMKDNPDLVDDLQKSIGEEASQVILAERSSWIEGVRQEVDGSGWQIIKASDGSVISDATQIKKKQVNPSGE
jgi:hypothetical protein